MGTCLPGASSVGRAGAGESHDSEAVVTVVVVVKMVEIVEMMIRLVVVVIVAAATSPGCVAEVPGKLWWHGDNKRGVS